MVGGWSLKWRRGACRILMDRVLDVSTSISFVGIWEIPVEKIGAARVAVAQGL